MAGMTIKTFTGQIEFVSAAYRNGTPADRDMCKGVLHGVYCQTHTHPVLGALVAKKILTSVYPLQPNAQVAYRDGYGQLELVRLVSRGWLYAETEDEERKACEALRYLEQSDSRLRGGISEQFKELLKAYEERLKLQRMPPEAHTLRTQRYVEKLERFVQYRGFGFGQDAMRLVAHAHVRLCSAERLRALYEALYSKGS